MELLNKNIPFKNGGNLKYFKNYSLIRFIDFDDRVHRTNVGESPI